MIERILKKNSIDDDEKKNTKFFSRLKNEKINFVVFHLETKNSFNYCEVFFFQWMIDISGLL